MLLRKQKEKKTSAFHFGTLENQNVILEVTGETAKQIQMIELTKKDLALLQKLQPLIDEHIEIIVEAFYRTLLQEAALLKIIEDNSTVDRLKGTLKQHIKEMFSGEIDEAYFEKRFRIARVHAKIGLEPKWYMCAFQNLLLSVITIYDAEGLDFADYKKAVVATTKLFNIEQQIVLDTYHSEHEKVKEQQRQERELLHCSIQETSGVLSRTFNEVSQAVDELVRFSKELSKQSQKTKLSAEQVEEKSEKGLDALFLQQDSMTAMQQRILAMQTELQTLQEAAKQIGTIAGLVESIAEQTNLLSLNASIESARAGESGKGFAVVASEVRKLAIETKASVSNVDGLIEATYEKIEAVTKFMEQVDGMVSTGVENTNKVHGQFEEVMRFTQANKKQSIQTEEEVTSFLSELDQVKHHMEEAGATMERLRQLTST